MRVCVLGDVVGEGGLAALEARLPALIAEQRLDFVVVNGENADAGYGISAASFRRIMDAGADIVTSGNHIWEKDDIFPLLDEASPRILRPANYPSSAHGVGVTIIEKNGMQLLVVNLQGREYMTPIASPFDIADDILAVHPALPAIVDFHAESSEEKEAMGFYLDGRVSAVCGTHTHVQTADAKILPRGTAYITDLGMTGPVNGVIGMDASICLERARTQVFYRLQCAEGECAVEGVIVDIDEKGRARKIEMV